MPLSNPLRRLLRIRELEEEQSRLALEGAIGEVNRIDSARIAAAERARSGRRLIADSAHTGRLTEKIAGLEECRMAAFASELLNVRLAEVEEKAAHLRERFLATRMQRMQAETLVEESNTRVETERVRHQQLDLDEWHRSR